MTDFQRPGEPAPQPGPAPTPPFAPGVPPVAPGAVPPAVPQAQVPPLASVIAKPKTSTGRGTSLLMALAAAIAIGGLAFAAGRLTAPTATASTGRFANGGGQFGNATGQVPGNGQGFAGRGGFGGGITIKGTVSAVSPDSITIKLASGTTVSIPLSSSTTYHTATTSSASAVTVGSEVSVTPGARTSEGANPNASPNPAASPNPGFGGAFTFGPATDVTVVQP